MIFTKRNIFATSKDTTIRKDQQQIHNYTLLIG